MFRLIDSTEKTEKFLLIDGLQRYTTIKQYVNGHYQQGGTDRPFKVNNKSSLWYKKTYEKLAEEDKDYFKDYSLKINVFDSVEDSERMQKLYMTTIFERINTGSTKLSNQEVRNAVYIGDTVNKIKEDARTEKFLFLLKSDENKYMQRCKNEEFYLRLLAYYHIYMQLSKKSDLYVDSDTESKITSSKDLMLCNFLFYCNKNLINYDEYKNKLQKVLEIVYDFQDTSFCTVKRDTDEISTHIHEVFSEALVIALMDGAQILITKSQFNVAKFKVWRDQESFIEFFHTTTETNHVMKRVETMKLILNGDF